MSKNEIIGLFVAGIIFAMVLAFVISVLKLVDTAQAIQIIISFVLVLITAIYVKRTSEIARATREQAEATRQQADASVKMAEEMTEQRIIASRPVIIQKAQQKKTVQATIVTDYFSHFEIYNAGNSPAIEPEIFLLDEKRSPVFLEDEITYLRAGEAPLKLLPAEFGKVQSLPNGIEPPVKVIPIHLIIRENCAYLVSQYQSIFSYGQQTTWYQTCLPFKSHIVDEKSEIRLIPGKLEFREVSEKERIVMPLVKGKPK